MSRGLRRVMLAATLLALSVAPGGAAGQEGTVAFPFTTSGEWEGLLDFSGHLSIDSASEDGSFTVKVSDVIGSTTITLDFRVDGSGQVSGSMPVNLEWFDEVAGAASNGDPCHVLHDHRQSGTLTLSGTASRLVASGTLVHETNTVASGARVEEVSGSEDRDVEWVFGMTGVDSLRVTGALTEASCISLMGSALLAPVVQAEGGTTYHNALVAELLVRPTTQASPEALAAALDEVTLLSDQLRARSLPEASHLLELVDAWHDLRAEVDALDACDAGQVTWLPIFDRSWLVHILRSVLETAMERPDQYDAAELVGLWDVGIEQDALDGDLVVAFLDALWARLAEAIELDDAATMDEIHAFAVASGYPSLQADAEAAGAGSG